jgi:hypothetical protein
LISTPETQIELLKILEKKRKLLSFPGSETGKLKDLVEITDQKDQTVFSFFQSNFQGAEPNKSIKTAFSGEFQ